MAAKYRLVLAESSVPNWAVELCALLPRVQSEAISVSRHANYPALVKRRLEWFDRRHDPGSVAVVYENGRRIQFWFKGPKGWISIV